MLLRFVRVCLLAGLGSFAAVFLKSALLVLTPIPESEPNNTPATANFLTSVDTCQAASGSITPNDVDYYSFSAPAGARVWALVDTSPSTAGNRDSLLTLFAPDGTTQLQQDDDDGTGTNCDGTADNRLSSAIAGQVLSDGGTYFLRVEATFAGDSITSYKLSVVVTTSAQAEVESNDTAATANPIVTAGSPIGVSNAAIDVVGDIDFYSVAATAGSTLLINASGETGTDVAVALLQPDGTTVILSADTSAAGFPPPPAESFCFDVAASGTYYVRVSASVLKQTTGPYSLMVAACGLPATPTPTPTPTATSVVGGPTATPTPTPTATVTGPTATPTPTPTATVAGPTATRTFTPIGGVTPADIPTLSFPMFALMGLGLLTAAFLVLRRL
jgi:hypothetical protein